MIPEKRSNFGKRFGFVRFKECGNLKELERKLDSIWIGQFKLRVNVAKYVKKANGLKLIQHPRQKADYVKPFER